MSEWQEYILEDAVERFIDYRGKTPPKTDSGIPLVTAKIVKSGSIQTPNEFISEETYDQWMTRGFPKENDVVLTTEAPLGEVALLKDENVALAQRIILMRGNPNILNNGFLKYYFQSRDGQHLLLSRASGTTVFGIKAAVLKKIPIPVPPIEEQKAITAVLASLDDKIDLLHRQNQTLESIAQTLFRHWFIDDADDDWEDGCLGDISENIRDSVKHDQVPNGTIYIGLEHIDKKSIALNRHGLSDDINSNKYQFVEEDVLFGKLRPYFHKVCFTPFSGICSTDILVLRPKKPDYFCFSLFAFYQKDVIDYANLGSGGTRMPRTNWNTLREYPIAFPPEKLIKQFNDMIYPSIKKIRTNLSQIRTLEELRDTLLPKLMSGEVRVRL